MRKKSDSSVNLILIKDRSDTHEHNLSIYEQSDARTRPHTQVKTNV